MPEKRPMRRKTRLLILAVLALVLAAVAIGAVYLVPMVLKSPGERRLVGTWELEGMQTRDAEEQQQPSKLGEGEAGKSGAKTPEAKVRDFFQDLGEKMKQWSEAMSPSMSVTFESDGTFSESVGFGGRHQVFTGRWEVVSPGDDQLTVRVYAEKAGQTGSATELEISFEGDDVMNYPGTSGRDVRMLRKKQR